MKTGDPEHLAVRHCTIDRRLNEAGRRAGTQQHEEHGRAADDLHLPSDADL